MIRLRQQLRWALAYRKHRLKLWWRRLLAAPGTMLLQGSTEIRDGITGAVLAKSWNTITTQGLGYFQADAMNNGSVHPDYIVLSTSTSAPSTSSTTCPATVLDGNTVTKSVVSNVLTWAATFGAGEGTGTIGTVALCGAADGTLLFAYALQSPAHVKAAGETIAVTYKIEMASA